MATFESRPRLEYDVAMRMSEAEARALEAMSDYSVDSLMGALLIHFGDSFMKKHEKGLRSLVTPAGAIRPINRAADSARNVFGGTHIAVPKTCEVPDAKGS